MKYLIKTIYLFIIVIFLITKSYAKDTKFKYSKNDISNYLSGIISVQQYNTTSGFKYLNKVKSLKNKHSNYNIQFIRTLILLGKFEEAFKFSQSIWQEINPVFEVELLLGLNSFIKNDYLNAEKYFQRLNQISEYNLLFSGFLGNTLVAWNKASQNLEEEAFDSFNKISNRYGHLKKIQNSFLQCYFNKKETNFYFKELINDEEYSFSRYSFFLANYLISNGNNSKANLLIKNSLASYKSNLLIKQANNFIEKNQEKKILSFFNCKDPSDSVAEVFYIIANLYSSQKEYQMSNFYLNISLFLNKKFTPNKALLAENFFNQKRYKLSQQTYESLKSIGPIYSWYASISSAVLLADIKNKEEAIKNLKKEFSILKNPNFEHFYEFANFLKNNENYKESIKYYSLALKQIEKDHFLIPKILDRRGTSYERLGDWKNAEQDLLRSLEILPDQPYVLNYLAYSWIEKRININQALEMLQRATSLSENDGYIIDSLGWAYYINKNYDNAEKLLKQAVKLMPLDPVINDHYADALWMQNKNIQARYFWKHVLSLDNLEEELKDKINKKLIFGINENL